jgi:hypothetical protein
VSRTEALALYALTLAASALVWLLARVGIKGWV